MAPWRHHQCAVRLIVRERGSGLTTEEMDASALSEPSHADAIAAYYPEERLPAMQLLGRTPTSSRAASAARSPGADIVTHGVPMPKITGRRGRGADA